MKDQASAAGRCGDANAFALLAQSDDARRRVIAEQLMAHLAEGAHLLARCQAQANARSGDRVGAISAAARLMCADAEVIKVLVDVLRKPRRSRPIFKPVQAPRTKTAELNSLFCENVEVPAKGA